MATFGLFLEGQVLTKSNENHCFLPRKISIANVNRTCGSLVLSECPVHTKLEKTTGFTEGMRTPSVEHNVWLCFHRCGMFGTCCL